VNCTPKKFRQDMMAAMRAANLPPKLIYVFKKTGYILTKEGYDRLSPVEKATYDDAIEEFNVNNDGGINKSSIASDDGARLSVTLKTAERKMCGAESRAEGRMRLTLTYVVIGSFQNVNGDESRCFKDMGTPFARTETTKQVASPEVLSPAQEGTPISRASNSRKLPC